MKESNNYSNEDKQSYLKSQIADNGYDEADFLSFIWEKKGESSIDIEKWAMSDLKAIVQEYILTKEGYEVKTINENTEKNNKDKDNKDKDNKKKDKNKDKKDQKKEEKKIIKKNHIKKNDRIDKIQKKDYIKLDKFEIIITPNEKKSRGFLSSISNIEFFIEIPELKVMVKRTYSDFIWLYQIIVNNYNNSSIPKFPKVSSSLFGINESKLKLLGEKLENLMNYFVNDSALKNTRVMFDFLTVQKNKDFKDLKLIYEKMKLSTLIKTDNDNNNDKNDTLDEDIYTDNFISEGNSVLNEYDYKERIDDIQEIQSSSIYESVINYLNQEDYSGLRAYCYKCSKDPVNKEIVLYSLYSINQEGKNNIYAKIDKFEILKIMTFLDRKNSNEYYKKMIDLLKDISKVKHCTLDEYFSRINKFSEIIKDKLFDDNVLERLGEENLRLIRSFIDIYYKEEKKEAVDNYLKEKYVDIINDYKNVICEKYHIDKNKIIDKLQNLNESEDMEDQISSMIQTLDEHERLYYDLLVQSILEAPSSESAIKSWTIPILKTIRDALKTIIGTAIVSLTGSKILTALSGTAGAMFVISDIKDIYFKKRYFSDNPEYRKLYHINQRNSYDKSWNIMKRNIKDRCRKIVNPIKNCYNYIVDRNILKLKEEEKIGFDREEEELPNIEEDTNIFIDNYTKYFTSEFTKKVELNYYSNLMKMKTKFEEEKRSEKYQKIKEEANELEKAAMEVIKEKTEKLGEKYPKFQENSFVKKKVKSLVEMGLNVKDFFKTIFFTSSQKQKSNSEIRLEILNDDKYKNYLKELDELQKEQKEILGKILEDEIYGMCKLTKLDKELFQRIQQIKEEEKDNFEKEISSLNLKEKELKIKDENDNDDEGNEKKIDEDEDEDDKLEISSLVEPLIKSNKQY